MPAQVLSLLIATGFVVGWSSGFVGGRLASELDTPVLSLFAWRFLLAALVVALWCRLALGALPKAREMGREMLVGSLTMGGYLLGVILAIDLGVSVGVTALIAALQPLLAAALAGRWLGERLSVHGWLGMGLATLGVALCVGDDMQRTLSASGWAYLLPLLSVVSVTLGSLLAVRGKPALPLPAALLAQLLAAGGIFLLAALVAGGGQLRPPGVEPAVLMAMGWLVVLSSLGGYGFFVASLRRLGVTQTAALVHLTPGVTLLWAAAMFGERLGPAGLAGLALAGAGASLAIRSARRSDPTRRDPGARHAPRTWSTDESPDAAHKAPSPASPY
ncbi:DMT family transporter [Halomonas kenyensis]|uniref:DMT family transporter n=1 Tax=Billgrantia kenyensis TaxID=321266 RepID=A0A7V9W2E9_9GAMM|nr:DMT family transporter [Halomonas kenyensis]MCG6662190.1 DMT family transporter [Halomonas kenyensis]